MLGGSISSAPVLDKMPDATCYQARRCAVFARNKERVVGRGIPSPGWEGNPQGGEALPPGRGGPSPRRGGEGGDGLALFVFIYGYPCQKFSVKGLIARACKKGACKERLRRVKPHYSVIRCNYM